MKNVFKITMALLLMISLLPIMPIFATEEVVSVYDGTSVSETLQGNGTLVEPYLISSGADLAKFIAIINANIDVNAQINDQNTAETTAATAESREPVYQPNVYIEDYYLITNDIVWSSYVEADGLTAPTTLWEPIYAGYFNGIFDGGNHTIYGLFTNGTSESGTGMFSRFAGTLKNLTIKDSYFSGNIYIGGFVGLAYSMVAENLTNYATIHAKSIDTTYKGSFVGGIIGRAHIANTTITINNCTNNATISNITQGTTGINASAEGPGQLNGGGIIGSVGQVVVLRINNCINTGNVLSAYANAYAGGIIGYTNATSDVIIDKCINTGNVSYGKALVGGIVGQAATSSADDGAITTLIKNCLNTGTIYSAKMVGGIAGRIYAQARVENCVTIGSVICNKSGEGSFGIVGVETGELVNSYILAGSAYNETSTTTASATGGTSKTEIELKGPGVVAALGLSADNWSDGQADEYLTVAIDTVDPVITSQTITATAGEGGSISPAGIQTVTNGVDYTFTIVANSNYTIKDVKIDGTSVGAVSEYTFNTVSADHTIDVTFEEIPVETTAPETTVAITTAPETTVAITTTPETTVAITTATDTTVADTTVTTEESGCSCGGSDSATILIGMLTIITSLGLFIVIKKK